MALSPMTWCADCFTEVSRCVLTQWHDPLHGMVVYRLPCMRDWLSMRAGMSADERAELEAMHAHERQLTDELDRLDAELAETKQRAEAAEAEKQTIYDEFQSLQAQVISHAAVQLSADSLCGILLSHPVCIVCITVLLAAAKISETCCL